MPAVLLLAVALLGGCAAPRTLIPTPNVYAAALEAPFDETLPQALRTSHVEILYATNRTPEPRAEGRMDYGIGRSLSLAVGSAFVDIGDGTAWEALAADARTGERERALHLDVSSVEETGRTPPFPLPYRLVDGVPEYTPQSEAAMRTVGDEVARSLQGRLADAPRREVLLYVHGVANSFDEAIATTAELWHYTGREFVPAAFTWPAGKGGLLRGYTYDRESSEFAVFHFKGLIEWLVSIPEVEGIHIVAHSRGTDVVTTGIRELMIAHLARGESPRERLKLRNVVLAAPDINFEVMMMRTATEFFGVGMQRLTLYTSQHDQAIGIAEFLFGGGLRLGQLTAGSEGGVVILKELGDDHVVGNVAVVEYVGEQGGAFGHDYFRTNPAVSSDLVMVLRHDRDPGAANGRPLRHQNGLFWEIGDDYPLK
jgi:esterase/lipase superfamily enzyme